MSCKCVWCDECGGSGDVWYSYDGEYLGRHRMDDLAHLEPCPGCDGEGIIEMCDACCEEAREERG